MSGSQSADGAGMPFFPPAAMPDAGVVAYLLYFRLIDDIGAAPALTVTFLIPLFGVLWGWLFLDEAIGWHTVAGSAIVIVGTALVTGFPPGTLCAPKGAINA